MADNVIVRVPEQQFIRGEDGYSPEVTIEDIAHGHSVTITDRDHPTGQSFPVLDGDSAYEQAVAGGYTGTEEQFNEELASFKELSDETKEAAPFYAEYFVTTKEEIEAAINYKRQIFLRPNQYSSYFAQFAGSFWYIESGISGTGYRFITTIGASQTVFELKNSWSFRTYNLNAPAERAEAAAATALTRMNSADASAQAAAGSAGDASTAATTATTKAGEATASATAADGSAKDSEAYAIGKRGGTDVGSTDPAYHNNSKYYAEQASGSATAASGSATAAASSASDAVTAKGAAETAQGKAEDAQEAAEAVLASIPEDYTALSEDVDDLKSAFNDYDSKTNIKDNYIDLTRVEGVYINSSTGSPLFSGAVNKNSNVVSFNNVTFGGDNWCMFLTGTTLARSNWQGTYNSQYDACYVDAVPNFVIGHIYRAHCFIVEGTYTLTDTTLKNFSYLRIADRSEHRSRALYNGSVWKCDFIPQIIGALVRKGTYNCKIAYYLEDITDSYYEAVPETKNLLQIFDKITAIGDSLTAGYTGSTNPEIGSEAAKVRGTNWTSYVGADIGRTITNLAVGSSSWKDWRYNTGSVDITSANIDTNCYIVGLGINDSIDGNTIGTSSDIAENKTNNADSVYGNADFVIRTLHDYNPSAHIFVLAIPVATVTNYTGINEALRYVSSQYDYTHCIDLAELYLNDYSYGIFENLRYGVHYEPLGYRIIANYLSTAINSFILTNYPLFVKVPYEL